MKTSNCLPAQWMDARSLHSFAADLRPQYGVVALGQGGGHDRRAALCLATLSLAANSVFNRGF